MLVTDLGIIIDSIFVPEKAYLPIFFSAEGNSILEILH